ncbi:cupin domain-containing protein [filamentous cyanobacterium LEGE 11480]|uniref:Cupin domain-containing protein n=1 Tax=Romeriopsis navalis LEGE 11480 TaxID=2777977 RepID=A0A928VM25_9CYAN|nr:cupin domain-containing protein [Romeriopsis navalis]MBE9029005.1 cupin domain-containing protein [Romeriopsis navalis LEGE 11480]
MVKSSTKYWNPLLLQNAGMWEAIDGTEGMLEQITLAIDPVTGDYTRLTCFKAGSNTTAIGAKSHDYPEEILIIAGRLYDAAFDLWLEAGHYASRPPGEIHGPFIATEDCLVLEIAYPSQATTK